MIEFSPLAHKIRPTKLKDFIGQEHLTGLGKPINQAIKENKIFSMIFWGPPGCGKTTLARIIAHEVQTDFIEYSATNSKIADVKKTIKQAKERLQLYGQRTILFIDEIHRFNKAQQDAFLSHVEDGTIILIGATTQNPSFFVIYPLLSRCRVFVLNPLSENELNKIITHGLKFLKFTIEQKAKKFLIQFSDGDARIGLNVLEIASQIYKPKDKKITLQLIKEILQSKTLLYDKLGDEHYNTISAFIKSMRASNVDSALYYLARMITAGEDPRFIARRMVIFASEDIGIALPTALVVANETFKACEIIGLPECQINLSTCVTYLCQAPKNRSAYDAYFKALSDVKTYGNLPIPLHLRNPVTKLMKGLGYGKGYEMYPDKDRNLLPDKLKGRKYFKK